jgi:hypothetical protein
MFGWRRGERSNVRRYRREGEVGRRGGGLVGGGEVSKVEER